MPSQPRFHARNKHLGQPAACRTWRSRRAPIHAPRRPLGCRSQVLQAAHHTPNSQRPRAGQAGVRHSPAVCLSRVLRARATLPLRVASIRELELSLSGGCAGVVGGGVERKRGEVHSRQIDSENHNQKKRKSEYPKESGLESPGEHSNKDRHFRPRLGESPPLQSRRPAVNALTRLLKLNSLVRNLGQCVAWRCAVPRDGGQTTRGRGANAEHKTLSKGCMRDPSALAAGPVGLVGPVKKSPAPTTRLAFLPTTACTRSWTPLDSLNQAESNGTPSARELASPAPMQPWLEHGRPD